MAERTNDKWLKTFCPEDACLAEEERFDTPEVQAQGKDDDIDREDQDQDEDKSTWLEVFCPEASCEIEEPTQLP